MLLAIQVWTALGMAALTATLVAGELTAKPQKRVATRRKTPRTKLVTLKAKAA